MRDHQLFELSKRLTKLEKVMAEYFDPFKQQVEVVDVAIKFND